MKRYFSGPPGHKVPSELIPMAIRWESLRIKFLTEFGRTEEAFKATRLRAYYQQRWIDEAVLPGPGVPDLPDDIDSVFR